MNKRMLLGGALLTISCLMTAGCYTTVTPGHVGIKVEQTGSQRGVEDYPVTTGRVFYNPFNENVIEYPTNIITYAWTHDAVEGKTDEEFSFKSSDFLVFTADVNASFNIIDLKAPYFYVKFRSDNISAFEHGFFRNVLRDSFNKYSSQMTADEINGAGQQRLIDQVGAESKRQLLEYGVNLVSLGFVHPPRPPAEMQQAITAKLTAVQNALTVENEVKTAQAQAEKQIALAQGKAKANQIEMMSITPQLIQMRALEKWNGVLPTVTGQGAIPFVSVNPVK